MKVKNLKLIANSDDDLRVISAHLQDSIVLPSDIAHLKKNRIFLIQLNRFMWEDVEKGVFRKNKRIRTILKFDNVVSVFSKNVKATYPNHKIIGELLDFSFVNNIGIFSTNIVYFGSKTKMFADKMEMNLTNNDTKIFMFDQSKKVIIEEIN